MQTRSVEVQLGFDPSAAAHDYAIELDVAEVRFLADGILLARWSDGLPARPMRVLASAWWPSWPHGSAHAEMRHTIVERISLDAEPVRAAGNS